MRFTILFSLLITISSFSQQTKILKTYSKNQLLADFDLTISALKEAHTGLYWYQSKPKFDSICSSERLKIINGMNSYDFFRITSKIVASTKEGHCRIYSSRDIGRYFNKKAQIPPVVVKVLNNKVYIINNIENNKTKGKILTKINNISIDSIINTIYGVSSKAADGFIKTGKLRYSIDFSSLAFYYTDYIKNNSVYELELLNPKTDKKEILKVKGVSNKQFSNLLKEIKYPKFKKPIALKISKNKIAQLTINSFRHTYYDKKGNEEIALRNFSKKIDSVFNIIKKNNGSRSKVGD